MGKKILVTGAAGFIGRTLVQQLSDAGHDVLADDSNSGDITRFESISQYFGIKIDRVIHLAAKTYVPDSWNKPVDFYKVNVIGTANVLELCRRENAALTYISAYLYGLPRSLPITETSPIVPNNPYAESKFLAEQLCEYYARMHGISSVIIRPFNVFGPGQDSRFLIPLIVRQVIARQSVQVADLSPRRDYVYVNDLVDALVRSLGYSGTYGVFNIGSGTSFSVKEIIDVIMCEAGIKLPVTSLNQPRDNEIDDVVADISCAYRELGWQPSTPFAEGIRKVLESNCLHYG